MMNRIEVPADENAEEYYYMQHGSTVRAYKIKLTILLTSIFFIALEFGSLVMEQADSTTWLYTIWWFIHYFTLLFLPWALVFVHYSSFIGTSPEDQAYFDRVKELLTLPYTDPVFEPVCLERYPLLLESWFDPQRGDTLSELKYKILVDIAFQEHIRRTKAEQSFFKGIIYVVLIKTNVPHIITPFYLRRIQKIETESFERLVDQGKISMEDIMNQRRRKQIRDAIFKLNELASNIDNIVWDEENSLENVPENLSSSPRAEQMSGAVEDMSEAVDILKNAIFEARELLDKVANE